MRIVTKGLKALDQDIRLEKLNFITGPNGSSKSTIAEAIRFLALGYVPALGKRPVDTAALMQNGSMSVELTFDSGKAIKRSLDRNDRGFTTNAEASWLRNTKPTETAKAIISLFGDEELDVAEALDIRELLAASPNQRAARIEQLLAAGGTSADEKTTAVARLIVMRLAETTEDRMPEDYRKALPMVPEAQQANLKAAAPMLKSKIAEAGIGAAVTWANEEKRVAANGLKQKQQAEHQLRERLAGIPSPKPEEISKLQAEAEQLQRQAGSGAEKRRGWEEKKTKIEAARQQHDLLKSSLESRRRETETIVKEAGSQLDQARAALRALDGKAAELKAPAMTTDPRLEQLQQKAENIEKAANAMELPEIPDASAAARRHAELSGKLAAISGSDWEEVIDICTDLEDHASTKGMVKILSGPIKRLRELAKKALGADPNELRHDVKAAAAEVRELEEKVEKATEAKAEIEKKIEARLAEARACVRERSAIETKLHADHDAAMKAYGAESDRIRREQRELGDKVTRLAGEIDRAKQGLESAEASVSSKAQLLVTLGELGQEPPAAAASEGRIKELAGEIDRLQREQAAFRELQLLVKAIEEDKAAAAVYSAIEWALQRQREVEISNAGGPLIRTMTQFLVAAGRKELPFVRASAGSCAIGWRHADGREVQIQVLSGGEWVLFAAALATAVIEHRKSVVKILLVEAGETDQATLSQLLKGIEVVIAESGMSAIVMSQHSPSTMSADWKVIATSMEHASTT